MIGGKYCQSKLDSGLLSAAEQVLTPSEREALWRIFQAIGRVWENLYFAATDSANLKSSWTDFLEAKINSNPSYVAEYSNAVQCVDELIDEHGDGTEENLKVFRMLFLKNCIPEGVPTTRLAHAKKYVIDEFIRVNIVASGFKSFGRPDNHGRNYKGYLGGSRYNIRPSVRPYVPKSGEAK